MPVNGRGEKARLIRNSIFSTIAWFFPIILGFVATPILVKGLGAHQYGVFAVILGFLSYSFTFGIGKVVAKFIPEYRASGENDKLSGVVSATFWFSLSFALIGSLTLALLAPTIVSDLLLIPADSQDIAMKALYLACATGLVMMLSQVFQYVLQGLHHFGSYVILTNLYGLVLGVGNIVLVLMGFGIVGLLCWNLFTVCLTGILFFIQARRFLPDLAITLRFDRPMFLSVAKYGGNIILFQVFANILFVFERTWVVRKFGPQSLTFYFVPMLLALNMHGLIGSFVQALFPVVNELLGEIRKLTRLYQKATKFVLAIVVFICTAYITGGKLFLTQWVDADLAANSYDLLVIHTLTFGLVAMVIIPLQLAEAFKFSSLTAIMTGSWMLIAIPLMILVADTWKSEGIALSRLIAVVITFPLIFFVEKRFLGKVFWKFWLSILSRVSIAAFAMAVVGYQIFYRLSPAWITLIAGMAICGLIYAGVLLLTGYLSRKEKDMIRDLILSLRRLGITVISVK